MGLPQSNIDWTRYMEGLQGKLNKDMTNLPVTNDIVVEHKVNPDGSWYRKYKSGWLEQGGKTKKGIKNITFVRPLNVSFVQATLIGINTYKEVVSAINTTGFILEEGQYNTAHRPTTSDGVWYACGQGA